MLAKGRYSLKKYTGGKRNRMENSEVFRAVVDHGKKNA